MAMMTRVEVVIVKIAGWRVILEWGGHLAKSCRRCAGTGAAHGAAALGNLALGEDEEGKTDKRSLSGVFSEQARQQHGPEDLERLRHGSRGGGAGGRNRILSP